VHVQISGILLMLLLLLPLLQVASNVESKGGVCCHAFYQSTPVLCLF
jgi:hypothetical protein